LEDGHPVILSCGESAIIQLQLFLYPVQPLSGVAREHASFSGKHIAFAAAVVVETHLQHVKEGCLSGIVEA
jgi:hypothetical protein